MKIEKLFTRKKANEGVEIPIKTTEGKEPVATITIVGRDSDLFKENMRLRQIENARILTLPQEQQQAEIEKADLELVASCVKGWSFENKFSKKEVVRFFNESPFIFQLVNESVMNRLFFMDLE